MFDDDTAHKHFHEFLNTNEYYKNSLDVVLENYYAIFKAGLDKGFDVGYDVGVDEGSRTTLFNCGFD